MEKRKEFWRALPFVMALLLLTLVPMQSASALFGKGKEEAKAVDGAPVAENMEIKVYRGVAYEGEFRAVDNEGDEVTFAIAQEPKKGMVALTEDGLGFVYTPGGKLGTDSFTYTAIDAYGNTSLPATVTGSTWAYGVTRPVRPTPTLMSMSLVLTSSGAYLYAMAQRGARAVEPRRPWRRISSSLMTAPSISCSTVWRFSPS